MAELLAVVELMLEADIAMGWPRAFAVMAWSSLSMISRVVLVSSSTSAEDRSFVGMGLRTTYG
jgi:hypothetical protein